MDKNHWYFYVLATTEIKITKYTIATENMKYLRSDFFKNAK